MNDEQDLNSEALAEEVDVASTDGEEESVSSDSTEADTLSLQELNETLGKTFKDKASALKAFKDTFDYVGKAGQAEKELRALKTQEKGGGDDISLKIRALEDEVFYSKHPEYEPYRNTIGKMGASPAEVVNSDDFKSIFEKVRGYDEVQKTKSVLETNPRLGRSRDALKEAREHESKGNREASNQILAKAVIEAFEE